MNWVVHYTYNVAFAFAAFEEGFEVWIAEPEPEDDTRLHNTLDIHDADGHLFKIKMAFETKIKKGPLP